MGIDYFDYFSGARQFPVRYKQERLDTTASAIRCNTVQARAKKPL